jgi:hypothetical protein
MMWRNYNLSYVSVCYLGDEASWIFFGS